MKLLLCAAAFAAPGPVFSQATAPIEFTVAQKIRRVPDTFFGIHDSRLYGIGREKDHADPAITALIKDVGFQILRGPDGTGANYYLWKEGAPLTSPDDPRFATYYGTHKLGGMLGRLKPTETCPGLTLEDIYKPAHELGLPYVFAVNVSSQSAAEVAAQVRAMRPLTDQPVRIELGNELYAMMNEPAFPRVADYVAKAREIRKELADVPGVQIAIVGVGADLEGRVMGDPKHQQANSVDAESTQKGRIAVWNDTLRKNADIYDAVTVHISPPVNGPLEKFTADSLMEYFFAFNATSAEKLRAQVESFPGKELWVTEWGFLPMAMLEEEGPRRDKAQFLKTPGASIARGERLLDMAGIPGVTITSSHDLLGGNGFGLTQRAKDGSFIKLPLYYVFQALGGLMKNYPVAYGVTATGDAVRNVPVLYTRDTVPLPAVAAYAFGDEQRAERAVFVNHTAQPQTVRVAAAKLQSEWTYGGGDPLPDFQNYPGKFADPPRVLPLPETPTAAAAGEITLQPYSMTICRIET